MNLLLRIPLLLLYFGLLYSLVFFLLTFLQGNDSFKKVKTSRITKTLSVTIAVPAYNEGDTIYRTIESIVKLQYPRDKLQIIVVNDGSKDNTEEEAKRAVVDFPEFDIAVVSQENQGKATAMNRALALARGELFACLDADSQVDPATLKKIVGVFNEKGTAVALVTPAMRVREPKNLLQRLQRIEYIVSILLQRLLAHMDSIYVAPGPFSVYRTKIIKGLGGFDRRNLTEDQEIAYRMQFNDMKIEHCPDGYVYTECPKSVFKLFKQRNRWFKGSLINIFKYKRMMLNKRYGHFGVFQMPLNLFSFFLGIGAVFFFVYISLRPLARQFKDLWLTNFDILTWLRDFKIRFSLLDLNMGVLFILAMLLVFTLAIFYLAHRNVDEKMGSERFLPLLGYFFVYYLLLAVFCCLAIIELGVGRRQKW